MRKFYLQLLFAILLISSAQSQPSLRGLYINGFSSILGNSAKEDSLLQFALDSSYNYMALYNLHTFNLSNAATADKLGSFIKRAKENYGIQYMGAVTETYSGIRDNIGPYNLSRTDDNEKFNVFNMEFEFWTASSVNSGGYYCTQYLQANNCNCDTSGAFKYFLKQLHLIDSVAAIQQVLSETYLGWFNQGQASQIQQNVDRILLHAYRTNSTSLYSYSSTRLSYLASNQTVVDIAPIFSSEPAFMGTWLNSHKEEDAYNQYKQDFDNSSASWQQYINIIGYHWFNYGYMPKPAPNSSGVFSPVITASGSSNLCSGNSVTLTATSGDSYMWSNGEISRSITLSSGGSFTCDVTLNGVTKTTPASNITVRNNPTASVSAGNLISGAITLTSTATAGSGNVSSYQWKLNNSSISGATSSSFDASTSGNYTVSVTNSYGCNVVSNPESVIIPGSNCVTSVPSGLVATAAPDLSEILSWTPGQTGDSIVVRYRPESGGNYTRIRMLNQGQSSVTINGLQPSTTYVWNVKTVCGTTQGTYSSDKFFTTGTTGIEPPDQSQTEFSETLLTVYPSPANENVHVDFASLTTGIGELSITDISGRKILTQPIDFSNGMNRFQLNTLQIGNGIYVITVNYDTNVLLKRVIIGH